MPLHALEQEVRQLMKLIYEKQQSDHMDTILENALDRSFRKYPEGIIITSEMVDELVTELMAELTPWIIHQHRDETDNA